MTIIFLSGSRMISRLPQEVRDRLDNIVTRGLQVITGDANGVDKAIQKYFSDISYPDVCIYHIGEHPRNNVGNWRSVAVEVSGNYRGRDLYTQKDKRMAEVSDCGMIVWDGQSSGSVQNMVWMVENHKSSLVFHSKERAFVKIKGKEDILSLLSSIEPQFREEINRKIGVNKYLGGNDPVLQPSFDL